MKRILVLGGGADQIDFIKELKSIGYYVIIIDYNSNPIAKPYADLHIPESTLDVPTVTNIAKGLEVERVVTACTDQALLTVAQVSEALNLPTQFSVEEVTNFTKKAPMKQIMLENNIPTAKFKIIQSSDDSTEGLRYPLIVKPSDCNSSKGVRKVENQEEFKIYAEEAIKLSRTSTAVVEEFLEGDEVSIDAYVTDEGTQILMIGLLGKAFLNESTQVIYQNTVPAQISQKATENIQKLASNIAYTFKIKNSPLLIQAIVTGDEVNVLEFSARLGGGCKHKSIKEITGIDIIKANTISILGGNPRIHNKAHHDKVVARIHLYLKPGTLTDIFRIEELQRKGIIKEFVLNKPKGSVFTTINSSTDRLGSVLIEADSIESLNSKKMEFLKIIEIKNEYGENMLETSIYKKKS